MADVQSIDFSKVEGGVYNGKVLNCIYGKTKYADGTSSRSTLLWQAGSYKFELSIADYRYYPTYTNTEDILKLSFITSPALTWYRTYYPSIRGNITSSSNETVSYYITSSNRAPASVEHDIGSMLLSLGSDSQISQWQYWLAAEVHNSYLPADSWYTILRTVRTEYYTRNYGSTWNSTETVNEWDITSKTQTRTEVVSDYYRVDLSTTSTVECIWPYSLVGDPRIWGSLPATETSDWVLESSVDYEDSVPDGTSSGTVDTYTRTVIFYTKPDEVPALWHKAEVTYYVVKRARSGEEVVYKSLALGDNEIVIKSDEPNFYLYVKDSGKYTFTASSSNAFLGYEEITQTTDGNQWETTWVEGTEFSLSANANDVLYICCSNQDFSDEIYTLTIAKSE